MAPDPNCNACDCGVYSRRLQQCGEHCPPLNHCTMHAKKLLEDSDGPLEVALGRPPGKRSALSPRLRRHSQERAEGDPDTDTWLAPPEHP